MTLQFNDFDTPPGLEDDVLAGCEIHKVIDAVCMEPGCPNGPQDDAELATVWEDTSKPQSSPIYRTKTKIRCIL